MCNTFPNLFDKFYCLLKVQVEVGYLQNMSDGDLKDVSLLRNFTQNFIKFPMQYHLGHWGFKVEQVILRLSNE